MANRYAVATGNWDSTSTWASTSSGSTGASVPGVNDTAYLRSNVTLTLTSDVTCGVFVQESGTLNLSSYKLTLAGNAFNGGYFASTGDTARTINLGSGTLELASNSTAKTTFSMFGTNLTFNAGSSTIIINVGDNDDGDPSVFDTLDKTFNDVKIRLGSGVTNKSIIMISGSPILRMLDIQSANSQPHEFQMDPNTTISTDIFSVLGASTSARLEIATETLESATINISQTSSGANASMWYVRASGTALPYIGSSSVQWPVGNTTWLLQDASTQTQGAFFQMF